MVIRRDEFPAGDRRKLLTESAAVNAPAIARFPFLTVVLRPDCRRHGFDVQNPVWRTNEAVM
ncbi:hypothetical protein KCP71_25180 [Salmonella enterica subsp. enterica]|nr:hypothetical protein KCP71_25180 [Salmonella enterica subsp. enterica]